MNNMQVEEGNPGSSSRSRKRQLGRKKKFQQSKKMKLDEQYEKMIKMKLRFVKKNKGEIPVLHFAARVSDVDVCRRLVEKGADVNEKCSDQGATALHYAAMNDTHGEGIIDYLVEKGCDIDAEDAHREKAIDYAFQAGNFMPAKQLFVHRSGRKATISGALHFCIKRNKLQFAKIVYNNYKGQEILWERPHDRFRILETACKFGDLEMSKWLLEEVKIDVNQFEENDWKDKILYDAAENHRNEASKILQYLFSSFRFTAAQQRNAYRFAFHNQFVGSKFCAKELEELFKRVADTKKEIEGENLLQYCVSRNNLNAAKFVHKKDGDLINDITEDGETILHLAARQGSVEMCQWLIDQGQDLYAFNEKTDANFLHYAAQNIINGADIIQTFGTKLRGLVNQTEVNGCTPLHDAMFNLRQLEKVTEALLELGADLSVKRKGNNLLHFCIVNRSLEGAKFVHALDWNLIKQRGEGRKTTLHIAVEHFDEEICAWLVKEGLDPRELFVGRKSVLECGCPVRRSRSFFTRCLRPGKLNRLNKCLYQRCPDLCDAHIWRPVEYGAK